MESLELKELILNNQRLIYSIVSKFQGDKEDLFQVGCIGLINAYKNYNQSYQTKFTTYAYPYIFGEIYQYVLKNKNIGVSHEIIKLNKAINKAQDFLSQQYKREPSLEELSLFLEVPITKIIEAKNTLDVLSLDDDTKEYSLYDLVSLEDISKDDLILLRDALNRLEEKEKELIIKRYFYHMTQSQIAKELGINQVKVSREEGKVLTKLRSYM